MGGGAPGPAPARGRRSRRGHRGLRGGDRRGRPRLHRRAGTGHPARRQGPHRGVLGPRRPRAHPPGHDVARPHRERRAAAGAGGPRARPVPTGRGAGPAGRAGRRARHARCSPAAATTSPPRRPPSASGSPTPARSCCRRWRRLDDLLDRYPLRGIKGPVGTQQDMLDLLGSPEAVDELERRWPPTSASTTPSPTWARSTRARSTSTSWRRSCRWRPARPAWPPPSA